MQRLGAAVKRHQALEALRSVKGEEAEADRQHRVDAAAKRAASQSQQRAAMALDHGLEVEARVQQVRTETANPGRQLLCR